MKLSELKKSEKAIIDSVGECPPALAHRLACLGIQKGQGVVCLQKSPVGGVTSYKISHGIYALEDALTQIIEVSKVETP